ncbi:putative leucine-rich repeat receptor-like serine/threonine-protein kinase, partial [Quercus suber]
LEPLVKLLINWEREIGISEWTRALVMTKAGRQHKSIQISHSATTMLSSAIATSLTMGLAGILPPALAKLPHLRTIRISSNNFIGRIPDFFQTWKQLQKLEIQASGLEGPIPPSISALSTLTELDLSFNRLEGNVPDLGGLAKLEIVFLTSNLLTGSIPEWIKSKSSAPASLCRDDLNLFKSSSGRDNL